MQKLVPWTLVVLLLGAVWWLASERNQRLRGLTVQNGALVIQRGRYFPTGMTSQDAIQIPAGAKAPGDQEFDDEQSLNRVLFDVLLSWIPKADNKAALVERASNLPGLTAAQLQSLTTLRSQVAVEEASALIESAARKLEEAHGPAVQIQKLREIQKDLVGSLPPAVASPRQ